MATVQKYTVEIEINAKGSTVTISNFNKMAQSAQSANNSINLLRRSLGALGIGLGIRELIQMADSVTDLRNRMRLLTDSTAEIKDTTQELFDIAKRTRSEFEVTSKVYTRMALAARQLGVSQEDLLQVTESINQAVILSGTTSREAANGLIQLSQAIASNRLGGDELRSVLEQLPLVADVIGDRLKKLGLAVNGTRGEVRQLGFDGKITAKIIIDAFKDAKESLEEGFGDTIPTISQALTYLSVSVVEFIAHLNDQTSGTIILAKAIILLADNLDKLVTILEFLAIRFVALKIAGWAAMFVKTAQGVGKLTTAIRGIMFVMGGWLGIIAAVGFALFKIAEFAGLNLFGGFTNFAGGSVEDSLKEVESALTNINKLSPEAALKTQRLAEEVNGLAEQLKEANSEWIVDKDRIRDIQTRLRGKTQELIVAQRGPLTEAPPTPTSGELTAAQKYADIVGKLRAENDALARSLGKSNDAREIESKIVDIAAKFHNKLSEEQREELRGLLERGQALSNLTDVYDEIRGPQDEYLKQVEAIAAIRMLSPELLSQSQAIRMEAEARIKLLDTETTAVAGLQRAQDKAFLSITDKAASAEAAYNQIFSAANEYQKTVEGLNAVLAKFPEKQEEVNRALVDARIAFLETQQSMEAGAERAFLKIRQEVTNAAADIETSLVNAFHGANDALTEFLLTGENGFAEVAQGLQRDLLKTAIHGVTAHVGGLVGSTFGISIPGLNKAGSPQEQMASAATTFSTAVDKFAASVGVVPGTAGISGTIGGTIQDAVGSGIGLLNQSLPRPDVPASQAGGAVTAPIADVPYNDARTSPGGTTVNYVINTPDANSFQRSQSQVLTRTHVSLDRARRRNR